MSASYELHSTEEESLNCLQAATLLEVSRSTFNRIRLSGVIPSYTPHKRPRFMVSDLLAYKESRHGASMPVAEPKATALTVSLRGKK